MKKDIPKNNMNIAIITDFGDHYGSGHYQRMASLLSALNITGRFNASFCSKNFPEFIPLHLKIHHKILIPADTDLIIRDMRDSAAEEIIDLQKSAPVIAVDDIGPGRDYADYRIDLLPNKIHFSDKKDYRPEFFLYGYGFTSALNEIGFNPPDKNIEAVYYPGFDYDEKKLLSVLSLFPDNTEIGVLMNEKSFFIKNRIIRPMKRGYTDVLLQSKILVTHFGITLYEGFAAGCVPIIINPSEYHSSLTSMLPEKIKIHNLGNYGTIDVLQARDIITKILTDSKNIKSDYTFIKEKINSGLTKFIDFIELVKK